MTVGSPELILVLALAIFLFGPKKLPELARAIGQAVAEYNKAVKEFEKETTKVKKDIEREISEISRELEVRPKSHSTELIEDVKLKPKDIK